MQFAEAVAGKTAIEDYIPRAPDGEPAADLIVVTAAAARTGDPCDAFKEKAGTAIE